MSMNLIKSCKPLNRSRSSVFCSTQLAAEAESDYWWLTTWPLNNLSQLIEEYCWERLVAQVIDAVHCMYVQLYTTLMQDVNVCTWWSLSVNCHRGIITMSFTIIINVMSIIIWLCLPVIVAWSPCDISVTRLYINIMQCVEPLPGGNRHIRHVGRGLPHLLSEASACGHARRGWTHGTASRIRTHSCLMPLLVCIVVTAVCSVHYCGENVRSIATHCCVYNARRFTIELGLLKGVYNEIYIRV